jgi:hypothetical protein
MRLPTALAVIALLVLTTTVAAEEPPRRLALLVGCSDYPFLLERHGEEAYRANIVLHGPENDVHLMRETLVNRLGVPEKHVTTLAGWPDDEAKRPTRANILAHLDRLAREARNGDRVILLMAGHGSQQHDDSGDELDGLDEIFLPADVTDWDRKAGKVTNSISDDELGKRLKAIRNTGATVWVILDCCHSGTGTRGVGNPEVRKRRLDPAFLGVPEGAVPARRGRLAARPARGDARAGRRRHRGLLRSAEPPHGARDAAAARLRLGPAPRAPHLRHRPAADAPRRSRDLRGAPRADRPPRTRRSPTTASCRRWTATWPCVSCPARVTTAGPVR